ncbi:MAG: hypothetical protein J7500_14240 [Sphingomonas sp.]|uniref:hypothetical protein n=1 Tax=Sphingomonas sp. TaxID=28214 RepID=UPI001B12A9C2|nr:hypothetical protein [Sphingomonas sp.]MBO9623864.1 hypothetical protein [Sphingomonas sp.]
MLLERLRFERELELLLEGPGDASAPFPIVRADRRTIYVLDAPPFSNLPEAVKTAALDELRALFAFVGGESGRKITVVALSEANFPQSFAFSDSVVVLIDSSSALQAHLTDSFRLQGQNAEAALRGQDVQFRNPFSSPKREGINMDRAGLAKRDKRIIGGRAFPFMSAYCSLAEIMSDFVDLADSQVDVRKVRQRRAGPLNARDFATHRALLETAVMTVLDNPGDPAKWIWRPELFGQLIGRTMAHEVRHTYVGAGHAAAGLGADGARVEETKFATFSKADQAAIARAIQAAETQQGRRPVVPTNPPGQPFPF